jgi:hypothetical protein
MNTSSTSQYLAAFGLGYAQTTLKERITSEGDKPNKKALLQESVEQLRTYRDCYFLLFGDNLVIPHEYVSDSQMVEFFTSLFEITEEKITCQRDKNLYVYFCAGGLIYLSDATNIVFDQKQFKKIFYDILCELGTNISWNEIGVITSQLYCEEAVSKREAKRQILDCMFLTNKNEFTASLYNTGSIYQSLLA